MPLFGYSMLFVGLINAVLCFDAKNVLVKEWDVHKGTSVEYQGEILYSFEFHLNKSSSKTIITIWKSNEKPTVNVRGTAGSRVAQFEISYDSDDSGTFTSKSNEKPTSFSFAEDDFSHYSTQFLYANYNYNIIFISQKVIEIAITDILGNDIDQYVAFLTEPVETTKMDPNFEKIINKPKANVQSSDDLLFNTFVKVNAFIQKNRPFIIFALMIFGFQFSLFLIFRCIKSLLAPSTSKAKPMPKAKTE